MILRKISIALVCVVAVLTAAAADAATITFEGHGDDAEPQQFHDGFTFDFVAAGWGIFTDGFEADDTAFTHNGTTRLLASGDAGSTAYVDIHRTDSLPFAIGGFDAATAFEDYTGRIEVIGFIGGIASLSVFFDLTDTFASFVLPGTFAGLSSIRIQDTFSGDYGANPGSFSVDNLLIDPEDPPPPGVPEPATLALVAMALVGLVVSRRRRG